MYKITLFFNSKLKPEGYEVITPSQSWWAVDDSHSNAFLIGLELVSLGAEITFKREIEIDQ